MVGSFLSEYDITCSRQEACSAPGYIWGNITFSPLTIFRRVSPNPIIA